MGNDPRQVQVRPTRLDAGLETLEEYTRAFDADPTVQNLMNLTWTVVDTAARLWFVPRLARLEMPDDTFFVQLARWGVAFAAKASPVPSKIIPVPPPTQIGVTTILDKQYSLYATFSAIFDKAPNYETGINIVYTLFAVVALVWHHARRQECITPLDEQLPEIAALLLSGLTTAVANGASSIPPPPLAPN